jgi:5'-deoxynucleotidase YfbR-like HD superfamily hydrolase
MKNENVEARELNKSKISIQECKTILNKQGEYFSDEEVKAIRDFLYALIEIDYLHFQKYVKEKFEEQILLLSPINNINDSSKIE